MIIHHTRMLVVRMLDQLTITEHHSKLNITLSVRMSPASLRYLIARVAMGEESPAKPVSNLVEHYTFPRENVAGFDRFGWDASDGFRDRDLSASVANSPGVYFHCTLNFGRGYNYPDSMIIATSLMEFTLSSCFGLIVMQCTDRSLGFTSQTMVPFQVVLDHMYPSTTDAVDSNYSVFHGNRLTQNIVGIGLNEIFFQAVGTGFGGGNPQRLVLRSAVGVVFCCLVWFGWIVRSVWNCNHHCANNA